MASRAENEGIPGAEALAASSAERPSLAPLVVPGDGLPWPDVQLPADVDPVVAPEDADATWRIHDRTHLELAVEYPVSDDDAGKAQYVWEAYFYLPRSLRIHPQEIRH